MAFLFNGSRPMKSFPAIALFFFAIVAALAADVTPEESWEVESLNQILPGTVRGDVVIDSAAGTATGTNGVFIQYRSSAYGDVVLMADSVFVNTKTYEAEADGNVRIESGDLLWVGDHIHYNFKTHQMQSEQFRTGKSPIFAGGTQLTGDTSNRVYYARDAFFTTDDSANPVFKIRASRIRIVPGKTVEMWNAVPYAAGVPVFYFPYYKRNIGYHANNFLVIPGYSSRYGAYFLSTYRWYLGDVADGKIHADYRAKRGPGAGPDANLHLGQWGDATIKYYYQHDNRPDYSTNVFPQFGAMPDNRQRFYLGWQATPATNLNLKAQVNYQSDPLFLHDFFPGEYTDNPQPNTFIEANKYWDNWSLDALTTPRINSFYDQVERLPDVKLTGYRQEVLDTPVYYDSESSVGWYRDYNSYASSNTNGLYAGTNGFYAATGARADTYHQFTLPWTFFNWLNVTPRVGGRLTYYSSQSYNSVNYTNGQPNSDVYREVFNTGVGTSFKASQLWTDATNSFWQVDGLRHIIEPSANYVFVPNPSTPLTELPQFDGNVPSLMLLPVQFPDYNNIDSVDSQNVVRFGLRNVLQTKRDGQLEDLVNWNMLLDWRLDPQANQSSLNDLYSQFVLRPRTWLTLESQLRYDIDRGDLNMAFHQVTFSPNDRWSWGIGHWYLRGGTWGDYDWNANDYITSTLFYRMSDNWGVRATHNYNSETGRLQEQFYTLYRDMRSWTAALTFRIEDSVGCQEDYTIAFSISLKANPSTQVGEDTVTRRYLLGE
jgi:hypothetical protein